MYRILDTDEYCSKMAQSFWRQSERAGRPDLFVRSLPEDQGLCRRRGSQGGCARGVRIRKPAITLSVCREPDATILEFIGRGD